MLLVLDNIVNVSLDSVVMVKAFKMNWFDLATEIADPQVGPRAFDGIGGDDAGRFLVTPVSKDPPPALDRAQKFFGQINDVYSPAWPDADTSLPYPAMKAGVAVTTPAWYRWDGAPRPPGMMTEWCDGYANVIFAWVVPPEPRQVTLTRIELVSYTSLAQSPPSEQPSLSVATDKYLVGVNAGYPSEQPGPPLRMAVRLSTWAFPNDFTFPPSEHFDDPWPLFLSNLSYGPPVAPPGLPESDKQPVTQTILLPDSLSSPYRDFLPVGDSSQPVPASPMVHFDLILGAGPIPMYRGSTDYSRAEITYDESQMAHVTDGFGEMAKTFAWLFFALVGMIEWPDPELGLLVNAVIDVANPPS